MDRIDAHHHFWHPARGDYGWLTPELERLYRPFGPRHLRPHLAEGGIARTVLVQAAPTTEETEYLLGLADATPEVGAVVGWVDFEDAGQRARLEQLAAHPALRGLRPMLQDISDPDWILAPAIAWALDAMAEMDLRFDALGLPVHIPRLARLAEARPELRIVLDHGLKPRIRDNDPDHLRAWGDGMRMLARQTSACCKLSGLVTEAGPDVTADSLRPYVDVLLETFGPRRLMWGSDWPVCLMATPYAAWLAMAQDLTAQLSESERAWIFGGTARAFYGIEGKEAADD